MTNAAILPTETTTREEAQTSWSDVPWHSPQDMQLYIGMLASDCHRIAWSTFFAAYSARLFELALLLTTDAHHAEAVLMNACSSVDCSRPPMEKDFLVMQELIVRRSAFIVQSTIPEGVRQAESLVQAGLRRVLYLPASERMCFVLCYLIGYSTSIAAQMLGTDESKVKGLLELAALHL